jgi:hypothetical protein
MIYKKVNPKRLVLFFVTVAVFVAVAENVAISALPFTKFFVFSEASYIARESDDPIAVSMPCGLCMQVRRAERGRTDQKPSTSTTAWAKACGASWGRLCPTPPLIRR